MGSLGAMRAAYSQDRYASAQSLTTVGVRTARTGERASGKLVPEGIEGRVAYKGSLADAVFQLMGGLRSGMGYVGAASLDALRTNRQFVRITNAGFIESHPHSVVITREAPNYQFQP